MNITFEVLSDQHQAPVMKIFNHYIESSTAAFPGSALPEQFFGMLMKKSEGLAAYALRDLDADRVVGFCQLGAYSPFSSFKSTATVTYFIAPEYTGKGLGGRCLEVLEKDAKNAGITHFVAEISSENAGSIAFHQSHGFYKAGELKNIGSKLERSFGVVYMQKDL